MTDTRQVGLIGYGAIGRVVGHELAAGHIPGATLTCVVDRHGAAPRTTIEVALQRCDLIVEVASQQAVHEYGRRVLDAGADLVVVSIGALAEPAFAEHLLAPAPGRLYFTPGAIGGLDLLAASRALGPFEHVTLTTTKRPTTLVQPWMDQRARAALLNATGPLEVYRGTASDVTARFPKSTNVAAAVALAVRNWNVIVSVCADPAATMTTHVIHATGPHGSYYFEIRNAPDETNPATSKVVPHAVLQTIAKIAGVSGQIV
jgi:aspartate dehydrogenase